MKDFTTFVATMAIAFPNVNMELFSCLNGYDLQYKGLYQSGYGTTLETDTHYAMYDMTPEVKAIFDAWLVQ